MTLSRRTVLEILAGSAALTAAGCNETPPPANNSGRQPQTLAAPQASAVPANGLPLLFTGLNLFLVQQKSVTVSMPKTAAGVASHPAGLILVGGTIAPGGQIKFESAPFLAGINLHFCPLAGKRLELTSDANPGFRAYDDPVSFKTQPQTADEWRSLRWVIDVSNMYRQAQLSLRKDWDTSLSDAVVAITQGEVMALPASRDFEGLWNVVEAKKVTHQQHMTGGVLWRLGLNRKLTVTLTDLKSGGTSQTSDLLADSTGPLTGVISHLPVGKSKMSHYRATEELFQGLSTTPAARVEIERDQPTFTTQSKAPGMTLALGFSLQALQTLFDILEDGSARCPPSSFRL